MPLRKVSHYFCMPINAAFSQNLLLFARHSDLLRANSGC